MKKRSDETQENVTKTEQDDKNLKKESKNAAVVYAIVLFVFVMLIMTLSYFIQQRHNNATISDLTEQHSEFSIQALENIEDLQERNIELTEELEKAENRAVKLEVEIEQMRLDWAEDVKNVEDTLKSEVAEEVHKREAAEKLLELYMAYNAGGEYAAELAAMEPLAGYLDGAYSELYQRILEQTQLQQTE